LTHQTKFHHTELDKPLERLSHSSS